MKKHTLLAPVLICLLFLVGLAVYAVVDIQFPGGRPPFLEAMDKVFVSKAAYTEIIFSATPTITSDTSKLHSLLKFRIKGNSLIIATVKPDFDDYSISVKASNILYRFTVKYKEVNKVFLLDMRQTRN